MNDPARYDGRNPEPPYPIQSSCCVEDNSEPCGPFLDQEREIEKLRAALTEAREALSTLDHPNGADSGLTLIRGGREIGTIIDAALGSTGEQTQERKP